MPVKRLLIGVLAACLIGCSAIDVPQIDAGALRAERELQLTQTLQSSIDQTTRIHNLLWPLLEKNVDFCRGFTSRGIGIRYALPVRESGQGELDTKVREAIFNFNNRPVVYAVAEDSPAQRAGLQIGDRIVGVGNWVWRAESASEFISAFTRRFASQTRTDELSLEIERLGERQKIDVTPIRACNIRLTIKPDLEVQARTNGREIIVTQGMAERLNDEQIRTVLAHELAHCTQRHIRRAGVNTAAGLFIDLAFLAQRVWLGGVFSKLSRDAMSISIEREADYVSMYLLANAGFDTKNRAEIWRNLADEVTFRSSIFTTHPYSPERYLLLTKTHDEIEAKRQEGLPVLPNGMRVRAR